MSRPFRLQLFGGMQLLAPAEPSGDELARAALLDNRRRVLAVLTVLAVSPRSLTRDQLADFFWGDSEPVRARHSLAESLRLLRRVLGGDAVATRTADVMLDAAVLSGMTSVAGFAPGSISIERNILVIDLSYVELQRAGAGLDIEYQTSMVPAPGAMALLGIAALTGFRRRR